MIISIFSLAVYLLYLLGYIVTAVFLYEWLGDIQSDVIGSRPSKTTFVRACQFLLKFVPAVVVSVAWPIIGFFYISAALWLFLLIRVSERKER